MDVISTRKIETCTASDWTLMGLVSTSGLLTVQTTSGLNLKGEKTQC